MFLEMYKDMYTAKQYAARPWKREENRSTDDNGYVSSTGDKHIHTHLMILLLK